MNSLITWFALRALANPFLVYVPTLSDGVNILRSSTQDTLCENCYITKGGVSPLSDSYMDNPYDETGDDYFYMVTLHTLASQLACPF